MTEGGEQVITLVVAAQDAGARLDRYLSARAPEFSRTFLQKLIKDGMAEVDGRPAKPRHEVKEGERVTLTVPPPEPAAPAPQEIALDIVHEDADLVVINKPPGLVVHPGAGAKDGTLVNALLHHCDDLSGIGGVERPGIVHRLDRNTSGLLVAAKHDRAHRELSRQLSERTMKRIYLALVVGEMPLDKGTISYPVGRDSHHREKMTVTFVGGRDAESAYCVARRFTGFTLLAVSLKTGRTHQIRVHLSHLRYPVVGDAQYGVKPAAILETIPSHEGKLRQAVAHQKRQLLHAACLSFVHPATQTRVTFYAALPEDFQAMLAILGTPPAPDGLPENFQELAEEIISGT